MGASTARPPKGRGGAAKGSSSTYHRRHIREISGTVAQAEQSRARFCSHLVVLSLGCSRPARATASSLLFHLPYSRYVGTAQTDWMTGPPPPPPWGGGRRAEEEALYTNLTSQMASAWTWAWAPVVASMDAGEQGGYWVLLTQASMPSTQWQLPSMPALLTFSSTYLRTHIRYRATTTGWYGQQGVQGAGGRSNARKVRLGYSAVLASSPAYLAMVGDGTYVHAPLWVRRQEGHQRGPCLVRTLR